MWEFPSLTRNNTGERDAGDSLEEKTIAVVSCYPQEEGLIGWNKLCDVPETVRLTLGIVTNRQRFHHLARDWQELQPVRPSRRREPSGVQQDVSGNTWKIDMKYNILYSLLLQSYTREVRTTGERGKTYNSCRVFFFFYNLERLTSLTLNRPTRSLFEVQGGLSGKPGSEINGAETWDTNRVSSTAGRLHWKKREIYIKIYIHDSCFMSINVTQNTYIIRLCQICPYIWII